MRTFLAALTALAVAAMPTAATAAPNNSPGNGGAAFAMSTPAEPVRPDASNVVHTVLTVANNGPHPIVVALRSATALARDDGRTEFIDKPNPRWSAGIDFPPTVRLAANQYRRVPLTIRIPTGLVPDLYLLGFIGEAQPQQHSGGAIVVYNQIGSLITVDIPGPRHHRVQVVMERLPWLHLGSTLSGAFSASNVGDAAALIRGQVRLDSALSHQNLGMVLVSNGRELLPIATARHETFRYETHDWFLLVQPSVELSYGDTVSLNSVTVRGTTTLVVPWRTVIVAALLLFAIAGYLGTVVRRRLKRRRAGSVRRHGRGRAPKEASA